MNAIAKILVPLDGSENAERIGNWVTGLAATLSADVSLVSVIDQDKIKLPNSTAEHGHPIPGAAGHFDRPGIENSSLFTGDTGMVGGAYGSAVSHAPAFGSQILDQVMAEASEYLARRANQMNLTQVRTETKTLVGDPAEEIVRYAREINADLIAMATHRGSSIARGVLGSVTDRVLHSAGIPVLAVHPLKLAESDGASAPPDTILVPLDGSERSASVVDLALNVATASEAEVVFTRVVNTQNFGFSQSDASFFNMTAGSSVHRHETEAYLEAFTEAALSVGVRARHVVLVGSAAVRLIEEVMSLPNPLIVMSTRGNSGIKRWVFGSVADKVVRSSGVPVIVMPPK